MAEFDNPRDAWSTSSLPLPIWWNESGQKRHSTWSSASSSIASPRVRKKLFDGFWRTLRPGGVVIMEGYGVKQLQYVSGGPKELKNLYTLQILRDGFAAWEILLLREYDAVLDEGPKHRGVAALVDLVARKPR